MRPVRIASAGCVCGIGLGTAAINRSLREGRSGVGAVDLFDTGGCRAKTAAQFPAGLREAARTHHRPAARWSRAAQAFLCAAAEALEKRPGFEPDMVIVGTTSGAMDLGEQFFRAVQENRAMAHALRKVRAYPPQVPVLDALRALGISAPVRIISNACASGANALGHAWEMVRAGRAKKVLVGGYDILAELVFAGFDCLQASTPELCRPFDEGRSGLVLGEGAAAFCVESEGPFALAGYGAATDTHHLTQPDPSGSGPQKAMERALLAAGWEREAIDHVNAHGTGTPQNDACEARAIAAVCPHATVTSTKALTGHTLGAAGAIEAGFCLAALQEGFLPPTLNFRAPDPGCTLDIVANVARPTTPRKILSNSFGFGGANASLLFSLA